MEIVKLWENTPKDYNKTYDTGVNKDYPYMEEFTLKDGKKHSCMLILPGGGYDHMSDHEGANVAAELNKAGISCFVLYYRLAPYAHPVMLYDVKRAVRHIRHNAEKYGVFGDKIGVMGFSAGGHLACMCAENYDRYDYPPQDDIDKESARPDVLGLCYPVITISKPFQHERSGGNFCGDDGELRKALSGEEGVRQDMPPVFMWHTFADASVDCRNSLYMASALKEKGCPVELHIFPDGKHGLDLARGISGTEQWYDLYLNWLCRQDFL